MTMEDSDYTSTREMEILTDTMIISLMEEMQNLSLRAKDESASRFSSGARLELSNLEEMKIVLDFYEDIIEPLWKIAENITRTSAVEEQRVGTEFMGSSGDGTYFPEISDEFNVYVMEEDCVYEIQKDLVAVHPEFAIENPNHTYLLKVLPTEKPGYFLLTWSDHGLELKRRYEEKLASKQTRDGASEAAEEIVPVFEQLIDFTEEIEHEGRKFLVISPYKIRLYRLSNPPTSIQGWPVWFRMQDQNSPAITLLTEEDKGLGKKKLQVTDLVLGVRTTMPCLKEEWVTEKQNTTKWLTQPQLEKLRSKRLSIVAKSWESNKKNLALWKVSFSGLERECVNALPPEPKICLIIAKAICRKFLSKPKGLISYHVKTVLFYTLDKNGSDWKKSERAKNVLRLLESLVEALKTRSRPRYFEPKLNTLDGMDVGTAAELEKKVQRILRSPRVLLEGCLFQSMNEGHKKEHFQKGEEIYPVWFDEKPPESSMFGEFDLHDCWSDGLIPHSY